MLALPNLFGSAFEGQGDRVVAMSAAGALHAAAFGLLLLRGSAAPVAVHNEMTVVSLSLEQAATAAPTPSSEAVVEKIVLEPAKPEVDDLSPIALLPMPSVMASASEMSAPELTLPTPAIMAMLDAADGVAAGGRCDLTEPVQAALRTSADVQAALPEIPRSQRSVANAIMIWNAQWIGQDRQSPPIATIAVRDVVAATIAAATPQCRMQAQTGPRLLTLPGTPQTTVLALGSGSWRWQDLLNTAFPDGPKDQDGRPIDIAPQFKSTMFAAAQ